MLTRLEVTGFKNLRDVVIDLGPFTCIAGENGVGKSNVFDAIEFLSLLTSRSFGEAVQELRGDRGSRSGDLREIFWNGAEPDEAEMSLAVEMLVPDEVEDDLGSPARATTTSLRYEVGLRHEAATGELSGDRIALTHESLTHITKGEASRHLHFPHSSKDFRSACDPRTAPGRPVPVHLRTGREPGGQRARRRGEFRAATTAACRASQQDRPQHDDHE